MPRIRPAIVFAGLPCLLSTSTGAGESRALRVLFIITSAVLTK
jgi:hypothetical protein